MIDFRPWRILFWGVLLAGTSPAFGQDFRENFPDLKTSSPLGVNLATGQYSFVDTDLKIGPIEVRRQYSGVYRNEVWPFSMAGYVSSQYVNHPAFGIAHNLRGYLYTRREATSAVDISKFVVQIEGQVLEFQIASSGDVRRWTVGTKGWSFSRSGGDILIRHKSGTIYRFGLHSGLGQKPDVQPGYEARVVSNVTSPNGNVLTYEYHANADLKSISSNIGYRVNFAYNAAANQMTVCGFNLAVAYVDADTACAAAQTRVVYNFGASPNGARRITSVTRPDDSVINYQYNNAGYKNLVTCITLPNSSTCRIQNEYWPLHSTYGEVSVGNFPDQVTRQILADGSVWNYDYDFSQFAGDAPPLAPRDLTPGNKRYTSGAVIDPLGARTQVDFLVGFPETITAPDGVTKVDHTGVIFNLIPVGSTSSTPFSYTHFVIEPTGIKAPGGNYLDFGYDAAGNNKSQRSTSNSGEPDIVVTRTYPEAVPYSVYGVSDICYAASQVLCDKPIAQMDALGNQTDYTYDAVHGGILTTTLPAVPVNGAGLIRPQIRSEYIQRSAWIKNASGAYVATSPPVWVKTRERSCKTTAASGQSCAGGTSDEVITDYEYGPDSGPNNLLLRGVAVTADGTTRRTCYSYDAIGRKISETQPLAGLPLCP